ncbi:PREDICTED: E3 ubiquitin-protein ligase ZNRF2 [Rhinopithecus bieti]|uniref:E3 ubiquitin-protein ligase ZNRF2 n=1 Tax=Rhinopithecus bieti TaxID=61621 RepID=UPI00083C1EDC|nr:PREDICTED: E3 ubiquitin-protein ligase ZNRF2 [Rhinopithecus bieti]
MGRGRRRGRSGRPPGGSGGGGGGGAAGAAAAHQLQRLRSGPRRAPAAPRSRSLGGAVGSVASGARAAQSSFSIPNSSSGPYGSQDSVHSSPEDSGGGRDRPVDGSPGGPRLVIGSLPAHLSPHMFGGRDPSPRARTQSALGCTWVVAADYFYPSPFLGAGLHPGKKPLALNSCGAATV